MRALAIEAGFSEAGVAALPHANEEINARRFREWLAKGRAGSMHYLERRTEDGQLARERVAAPFPWARSVLVCFASYLSPEAPLSTKTRERGSAWIARYAWSSRKDEKGQRRPSDYHKVLLKRLRAVEAKLREEFGQFESRAYVDTGPVVERSIAVAAGLGWTGKNTCLIHPRLGSFGFLAVLVTSLDVSEATSEQAGELASGTMPDERSRSRGGNRFEIPDRCGSCTRCIDACPTHALDQPYQMDATRCIAYLTIEHKGPIAEELMPGMGRQVFGCDICQDVCPWNRRAPIAGDPELAARGALVNPSLEWLGSMDEAEFERVFNGSPVRRAKYLGFRRNVAVAMGNSGQAKFRSALETWAENADRVLAETARWALGKLQSAENGEPG